MKIWLSTATNVGYVWNVHDAFILRENHRILGSWIGCPSQAFQSSNATLPLLLMPEEIDCLIRNKVNTIRLLDINDENQNTVNKEERQSKHIEAVTVFESLRNESYQDQIKLYKNIRESEVLGMADKIVEGKKRKLRSNVLNKRIKHRALGKQSSEKENVELVELSSSEESDSSDFKSHETSLSDTVIAGSSSSEESHISRSVVISEELKKIKNIPPNLALVQTFYENPWLEKEGCVEIPIHLWTFGEDSAKDSIRSATFRYLWNEGFYLTAGDKFGADFLAYPGDPVSFHASYVVICHVSQYGGIPELSEKELVAKCRLGTTVKKTVLLSYFDDTRKSKCGDPIKAVKFKRLIWTASNASSEETKPSSSSENLLESPDETISARDNINAIQDCQSEQTCSRDNNCDIISIKSSEISSKRETATTSKNPVSPKISGDIENVLKDLGSPEFWKPFD